MEGDRMSIERLENGSNWLIWKFQIRQILEASELFDVVDGTTKRPITGGKNYETELVAWKKSDAKARRAIATTCMKQPLLQIMNCETASEMWTTLKSTYEQASKSNILFLQQKYYKFEKEPEDDIGSFLSKLMEVVQQLKDQKENISDSMVMTKILMSLPAEYNHFHSAWESASSDNQTMANLRARLMAEELRLKSQGRIENVEALMAKQNFKKKNNFKMNNSLSGNNTKGANQTEKSKGNCFKCGKSDHWKRDCPQRKNNQENEEIDAFICSASNEDKDIWILDSGASDHMSHHREWFEDFKEASVQVTIGNGVKIMARGKGDISILAYNGDDWIRKRMVDVLYVPELHINLFSSGKVMDHGYKLKSDNKRCELLKNGNIVAVGVRQKRLFQMMFKIDETSRIEIARDVVFMLQESMAVLDCENHEEKADKGTSDEDETKTTVEQEQHDNRGNIRNLDNRNIVDQRLRDRSTIKAAPRLSYNTSAYHIAMSAVSNEPKIRYVKTYKQAMNSDDHKQWEKAMDEECDSLTKNHTWVLVKLPADQKVIDNRWVFKIKHNPDGSIDRYKARLVVRGFTQEYGIDYQETFSPVVRFTSIRVILFCKLSKSLYGLKQASRCWNKKFTAFMKNFGFRTCELDPCVFMCNNNGLVILAIHVDVRYHFIREKFEDDVFDLKYVPPDDQIADIMTRELCQRLSTKFFVC